MKKDEAHRLLCERGWLAGQPEEFQRTVLAHSVLRTYYDGESIYTIGDPPRGVHALVGGVAKLTYDTRDGNELLLKIFSRGDWFGMISLLDALPLPNNVRVCSAATLLTLPQGDFEQIVSTRPDYLRNFSLITTENMRHAMERVVDLGTLTPAERLAKLLLRVLAPVSADGRASDYQEVNISQWEMSSLITASRATVNKLVKEWSERGWIGYRYRKLRILDPGPLAEMIED